MSLYAKLLDDALSMEKADPTSAKFANEEGYVSQGDVLIELPMQDDNITAEVIKIADSLESKGWRVHIPTLGYSTEGSSDGVHSGLPSMNADNAVNNVINGVYVPELKTSDVYQVVQVVRPEDTVPQGMSKILYLMNGDGEIKDMLRDEGHLVVDEKDALHLMLKGESVQ
jgi:hypothetical protein